MPFRLSYLNSNLALTLGYLNLALNNSAQYFNYVQTLSLWMKSCYLIFQISETTSAVISHGSIYLE